MVKTISARAIIIAIALGIFSGYLCHNFAGTNLQSMFLEATDTGGHLFLKLLKLLVVPVVSISIMCGISQMEDASKIGKMGLKTFILYILTTAIAIGLAMLIAINLKIGSSLSFGDMKAIEIAQAPSFKETLIGWIPDNALGAMVNNNMLQIILFATLIGIAIIKTGKKAKAFKDFLESLNEVLMVWVMLIMQVVPLGVFCLMAKLAMTTGLLVLASLGFYALTVVLALGAQVLLVYGFLLRSVGMQPLVFFKKMWPAQLFAFSVSSSSASIPVVLTTIKEKLGVSEKVANFVIPLGATINMDGTAIMQGVATIFIANAYHISLSTMDLLTIMGMATMASIGTAGVPSVGLITLAMVLEHVGLPIEGIALIIGIDRILDMLRTAVNITGDAVVAFVVNHSENTSKE